MQLSVFARMQAVEDQLATSTILSSIVLHCVIKGSEPETERNTEAQDLLQIPWYGLS